MKLGDQNEEELDSREGKSKEFSLNPTVEEFVPSSVPVEATVTVVEPPISTPPSTTSSQLLPWSEGLYIY